MSATSILAYIILTLSIGYAFVYPSWNDIRALMDEKQKYQDSLDKTAQIESRKNELLAELNSMSAADRQNIETVVPSSLNFVKLVSDIDAVGAKRDISISKITFQELNPSIGGSISEAQAPNAYQSALIGFSFTTNYDNFRAFLDELETSMRILDVKSLKIDPGPNGATFQYSVEFEAYWLKST